MTLAFLWLLAAATLFGAPQAAPAVPVIATAEFGWFVPQGVRVQTLGEISSRRAVIDATHRSTEVLFSNPSGNPVIDGEDVLAVRFLMQVDCETGSYRFTETNWLARDGRVLRTIPLNLAENSMGPMTLIIGEVCGGPAAATRDVFNGVEDYVVQSESRPAAPSAGPPTIRRMD